MSPFNFAVCGNLHALLTIYNGGRLCLEKAPNYIHGRPFLGN